MKRFYILAAALAVFIVLSGCMAAMTVTQLKENANKYIGEKVTVEGTATNSTKIGELSGFRLSDGTETIIVASNTLPAENAKVVVRGTLMTEVIVGYYILADSVQLR
jgi:uncharacterized protein YdeI (BOF family)